MRLVPAPRRPLNPHLLRRVNDSGVGLHAAAVVAGFPHYSQFYEILRSERVVATALNVGRLMRVADAVGFPRDQVFLDAPTKAPRLVKRSLDGAAR